MLYCGVNELEVGMTVAAPVFHPRRPDIELLSAGVELESPVLPRLKSLGVPGVWVDHDLTADLDALVNPSPSKPLRTAFQQLKHDFAAIGRTTVSSGHVQTYRQIVMELVCELIANRSVCGLTERLVSGPPSLFTHSANVAYLSISTGIELETYIVDQRRRMANEYARDLTGLGLGAMLHDIGKVAIASSVRSRHELGEDETPLNGEDRAAYRSHPALGFRMLRDTRAPASARQVVLNHHQRWDGSGFPDIREATGTGRDGVPQGEQIHVFSRIVAAANVLDNLLHEAGGTEGNAGGGTSGGGGAVVAALHAFASDRFDGWFDPVVRDAMLRRVPPFPVGSRVVLSDQRPAVVVAPSLEQPCRPAVRLLDEHAGVEPESIDLRLDRDLHIIRCGGVPVEDWLYEMPEQAPLAVAAVSGR